MSSKLDIDSISRVVFRTISRWRLVERGDVVFVGLSGGKDSLAAAYFLKEFVDRRGIDAEIVGFHLDWDLEGSGIVRQTVQKQCEVLGIPLKLFSVADEISLEELSRRDRRPICSLCGTIKRYLLNRVPRQMGATKLATGHHADDYIVFFFKNFLGRNFEWISKFKPLLRGDHPKQLTRIRPLMEIGSVETEFVCKELGLPYLAQEVCPYVSLKRRLDRKRRRWYETIYEIESWQPNFRRIFVDSIIASSDFFRAAESSPLRECARCGEPTSLEVCAFCRFKEKLASKGGPDYVPHTRDKPRVDVD